MANGIVIATLDDTNRVISFMDFDSEARLEQVMKACKGKGLKVRTMSESEARRLMLDETPVVEHE